MHKKLEANLISLAHQILQLKDKKDVIKLRDHAKDVYEKLSVLAFVNNYFLTTPNALENKEDLLKILENSDLKKEFALKNETLTSKSLEQKVESTNVQKKVPDVLDKKTQTTITTETDKIVTKTLEQKTIPTKEVTKDIVPDKSLANNDEFKDSIPADVAANLFEKAERLEKQSTNVTPTKATEKINIAKKVEPIPAPKPVAKQTEKIEPKTSLNDRLLNNKLQVGLNDRIAFVKHLFNYSQEDFNRVLSQLNTFETEVSAKDFIKNQVKPEYNWTDKEEYEERLLILIERKFM